MNNTTSHWYEAIVPTQPDRDGASIVGYKWVEVRPGKSLPFTIIRQRNGDFVVRCDQTSLAAAHLPYRPCTIYASQAQVIPSQVIWSIILEGINSV